MLVPGADWRHPLWDWHLQSPSTPSMLLAVGTIPAVCTITDLGTDHREPTRDTENIAGTPQTCWNSPPASLVLLH